MPRMVAACCLFPPQVRKVAERFGCQHVTFVGDRGMIKSAQTSASSVEPIEDLSRAGFHYITALTKPQIEALLRRGTLQMELFDETVCEVESDDIRYVLRRNAHRADDLAATRRDKRQTVQRLVEKKNACLQELTLPGRKERVHNIPRPRHLSEKLIRAAGVRLPKAPPSRSAARLSSPKSELAAGRDDPVVTKRTLSPRRTEP